MHDTEDAHCIALGNGFATARHCGVCFTGCRGRDCSRASVVCDRRELRAGLLVDAESSCLPDRARTGVCDCERFILASGDQVFERFVGAVGRNGDDTGSQHDLTDERVVLGQHVGVLRRVEHGHLDRREADRVAVGSLLAHVFHGDGAGCAGHVLGDDAHTQLAFELGGECTAREVGSASGICLDDEADVVLGELAAFFGNRRAA